MLRRLQASSKESWELFLKFADRFGLSPRSRIGLAVKNPNHDDTDLMELLSTPRVRKIPPPKAIVE
jgi:phage terminase small subunit